MDPMRASELSARSFSCSRSFSASTELGDVLVHIPYVFSFPPLYEYSHTSTRDGGYVENPSRALPDVRSSVEEAARPADDSLLK